MEHEKNQEYFKLVVAGAVNAGKTSFVTTISEIEPITTDEMVTEERVRLIKGVTTVAMDYGRRTIDEDIILHIYATPGQERFSFMWDVLVDGAFGVIFLADSTNVESLATTGKIIRYFDQRHDLPYLLCVTKLDSPATLGFHEALRIVGVPGIFSIPCRATDREEVRAALVALLTLAIDRATKQLSNQ